MAPRSPAGVVVLVIAAAMLGAVAGYAGAQRQARDREVQRADLINATRAAEFGSRLTMLRLLREAKLPSEKMESAEISAIVLLGTIALRDVTDASQSHVVVQRAAQTLATYIHDFPKSQFSDPRYSEVAQFLAFGRQK
jgi:hypothetical protein